MSTRKLLLLLVPAAMALGAVSAVTAAAETAVPIRGDRTTGYPILVDNGNPNGASAMMFMYTRDELQALPPDVLITGLELDKVSDATTGPGAGSIEIYLANTTDTTGVLATLATHKTGATLVYSSTSQRVPASQGWWSAGAFNGSAFTYTGQTLKVIVVWNGTNLPAQRSYNRNRIGFGGQAAGSKALSTSNTAPIADSAQLFGGQSRPNVRLTFTPPPTGYLVMSVGDSTLTSGATYQNAHAFAAGTSTPQHAELKNAGGAPIDLSAGFAFTNQTNTTNATLTAPPALLGAGAVAAVVWNHTPVVGGAVSYTTSVGGFSFTQQGTAGPSAQTGAIGLIRDVHGRSHAPGFSGNPREVLVNVAEALAIRVINTGTAPITSVSLPTDMANNLTVTCDTAGITIPPGQHSDLVCTSTSTAVGSTSIRFLLTVNGLALNHLYLGRTALDPAPPPPVGVPQIAVSFMADGVTTPMPIGDEIPVWRGDRTSDTITLTIANTGTGPLTVSNISTFCEGCSLVRGPVSLPLQVPEGQSRTVTAVFVAPTPGAWAPELDILSDDPDVSEQTYVARFLYGPEPNIVVEWPTGVIMTSARGNDVSFEIFNTGTGTLRVEYIDVESTEGCDSPLGFFRLGDIAPGASAISNLTVEPFFEATTARVTLSIASNDPDQPLLSVPMSFAVRPGDPPPPPQPADGGCLSASDGDGELGAFLLGLLGFLALHVGRKRARLAHEHARASTQD